MNRTRPAWARSRSSVPRASGDEPGDRPRETVISHSVRTAGYVQVADLIPGSRYRLIEGSLEAPADEPVSVGRLRPGRWDGNE